MKKYIFLKMVCFVCLLLLNENIHAQSEWLYLYSPRCHADCGSKTPNGHLAGGYNVLTEDQLNRDVMGPMVIHADNNGKFTSGLYFNYTYEFTVDAGYPINVNASRVIARNNGTGYMVAATFTYNDTKAGKIRPGLLLIALDNNGELLNPGSYAAYKFPNIGLWDASYALLTALRQGNGETFLACGQVRIQEVIRMFAIEFTDQPSITTVSGVYDLNHAEPECSEMPGDIIQSPYTNEIFVVGEGTFHGSQDGFILRLNGTTGSVVAAQTIDLGGYEGLTGIVDNSGDIAEPGFGICGYQKDPATNAVKPWLLKWDQNINTVSTSFIYNNLGNPNTHLKPSRIRHYYEPDPSVLDWRYSIGGDYNELPATDRDVFISCIEKTGQEVITDRLNWGAQDFYAGHSDGFEPSVYGNWQPDPLDVNSNWCSMVNDLAASCTPGGLEWVDEIPAPFTDDFHYTGRFPFASLSSNYLGHYDNTYWEYCERSYPKPTTVAKKQSAQSVIQAYPNPVSNILTLYIEDIDSADYTVTNLMGCVVGRGRYDTQHKTVNVADYPTGLYLLIIKTDNTVKSIKFMKE